MKNRNRVVCTVAVASAISVGAAAADRQSNQQPQQQQQQKATQETTPRQPATPVRLSQLEENPQQYVGRRISVSGEVGDVLGPRVFKIDESNWADLDGEILVVMEAPFAALVKEEDPVTVTGTMRNFTDVRVEREWGWLDLDPEIEARIKTRPVLVATSLVGTDPDLGLFISVQPARQAGETGQTAQAGQTGQREKVGTSGTSGEATPARDSRPALTDAAELAKATDIQHVGRRVTLSSARVERTVEPSGFWVSSGGDELFVLPADSNTRVQQGQTVTIEGHVLRLPEQMEGHLEKSKKVGNEEIYVYASSIK